MGFFKQHYIRSVREIKDRFENEGGRQLMLAAKSELIQYICGHFLI